MSIMKREFAPIDKDTLAEIDSLAAQILKTNLSARKFIDVGDPKGWDYAAEPLGRLYVPENQDKSTPRYGIHQILPLVEVRKSFKLNVWELDNLIRGAKDINLDALEEATQQMAAFEDNAIYNGFREGNIRGILENLEHEPISVSAEGNNFLAGINKAVTRFRNLGIEGPYVLVINPTLWEKLLTNFRGYPLKKHVSDITSGSVLFSSAFQGALLVSTRGGDFELILGEDFSIGYESHTKEEIELFISESFTFRIIEPKAIISLNFQ